MLFNIILGLYRTPLSTGHPCLQDTPVYRHVCIKNVRLFSVHGSLMSRIGLRLGGTPAHESQLDHTRRIPWAVKEMMEEEKRQQDTLPFLRRAGGCLSNFEPIFEPEFEHILSLLFKSFME